MTEFSEYIDRNEMMRYLKAADIPVTRHEREIIEALPTLTDIGDKYKEKIEFVEQLVNGMAVKNRLSPDARCSLYGRKRQRHGSNR